MKGSGEIIDFWKNYVGSVFKYSSMAKRVKVAKWYVQNGQERKGELEEIV